MLKVEHIHKSHFSAHPQGRVVIGEYLCMLCSTNPSKCSNARTIDTSSELELLIETLCDTVAVLCKNP